MLLERAGREEVSGRQVGKGSSVDGARRGFVRLVPSAAPGPVLSIGITDLSRLTRLLHVTVQGLPVLSPCRGHQRCHRTGAGGTVTVQDG